MSSSKAPVLGVEWWLGDASKDQASATVSKLNLEVAELRCELNRVLMSQPRTPEIFEVISKMMQRALELEQEYQRWEETQTKQTVAWVDNVPGGDMMKADVCP